MIIKQKIKLIIIDELGVDENEITDTCTLQDLGADSLDTIEVVMRLEEQFGIDISDDEIEDEIRDRSISDLVNFIEIKTTSG